MKTAHKLWFGTSLLLGSCHLAAYEVATHKGLSKEAYGASAISLTPSLLTNFGIDPSAPFRNALGDPRAIVDLFQDGAKFEDNFPRPTNHFYNPLTGEGLFLFTPSPDWAIDGAGDSSSLKFSYKAARQYLFDALTDPSVTNRQDRFGLMFQSLGHLIHYDETKYERHA